MCLVVASEVDKLITTEALYVVGHGEPVITHGGGGGGLGVAVALGEQYILLLHVLMESLLTV